MLHFSLLGRLYMKARIKWVEGMNFVGEAGTGHGVVIDGGKERGGRDTGFRPMEMLLLGLGGCTAVDVKMMLEKGRQEISDCIVEVEGERVDAVPAVFTKIHVHYIVTGKALKEAQVKRAVELSSTKYCSASIMLGKSAEVTHSYEIIEG
jgi:putative redox protein